MVQRKDTLGFVEFMRGKYNIDNVEYIEKLLSIMTYNERKKLYLMISMIYGMNYGWIKPKNNISMNMKILKKILLFENGVFI